MCDKKEMPGKDIKEKLRINREKLKKDVEDNSGTVCEYLSMIVGQIKSRVHITSSDGH